MSFGALTVRAQPGTAEIVRFNRATHCVTEHFLACLDDTQLPGNVRLALKVGDEALKPCIYSGGDQFVVHLPFDFDSFWFLDRFRRKKMILDRVVQGVFMAASETQWPHLPFRRAAHRVLAEDLRFRRLWKQPLPNPAGTMTAQLLFDFDIDHIRLYLVTWHRTHRQSPHTTPIVTLPPHPALLTNALGHLAWLDDHRIVLRARRRNEKWFVSV